MSPVPSESSSVSGNILWSTPRSMSTVFFRAIESHPDTVEAIFEPFSKTYYLSEDRLSSCYPNQFIPGCGYMDTKRTIEKALLEAKAATAAVAGTNGGTTNSGRHRHVFVKDMAFLVYDVGYDLNDLLPRGYRHTFLVRHPRETLRSLYRVLSTEENLPDWTYFEEKRAGFKHLWKLYEFVRDRASEEGAPPPMVIGSADLLRSPERYLRAYCDHIGLTFDKALLKWKPVAESVIAKEDRLPWDTNIWYGSAIASDGFREPKVATPDEAADVFPEFLERCIQENLGYYENFMHVKTRLD